MGCAVAASRSPMRSSNGSAMAAWNALQAPSLSMWGTARRPAGAGRSEGGEGRRRRRGGHRGPPRAGVAWGRHDGTRPPAPCRSPATSGPPGPLAPDSAGRDRRRASRARHADRGRAAAEGRRRPASRGRSRNRSAPGELVPVQPVKVRQGGEGKPPLSPRVMGRHPRGWGLSVDRGACGRGY